MAAAEWREDLRFLARELPRRHADAFHFTSCEIFEKAVAELDRELDQLNSDQIYVGMNRITNLIGDGHTYILSPSNEVTLPVKLERLGDEYRVVATTTENDRVLGGRVIKIENTPIMPAHDLLLSLTPADETLVLRDSRVTALLTRGSVLHGTDIIRDRANASLTIADDHGGDFTVDVRTIPQGSYVESDWIHAFRDHPPLFRQRPNESFWSTNLSDSRVVYVSFRGYQDLRKGSKELFQLIRQHDPEKLVIDLRLNGGGDYAKGLKYVVNPIRNLSKINRRGHLFVLIGPNTFSAAMSNSAHFRYRTNAILVGQQIGEKPNSYQEARQMKLPKSHWKVQYSVKFYKFVESGENLIRPDEEITPSWDDYRSGRDPVLNWVLNYKP